MLVNQVIFKMLIARLSYNSKKQKQNKNRKYPDKLDLLPWFIYLKVFVKRLIYFTIACF